MQHELPASAVAHELVAKSRSEIRQIIRRQSDRLLVVVGPCSIHDPRAALSYADRLVSVRNELSSEIEIVMRAYFEKPRTRTGWKGLLCDPHIDDTCDIERGVRTTRGLLARLTEMGMPVTTEFLSPVPVPKLREAGGQLDEPIQLIMRGHRPFYGTSLRMVSPGERIECGWQDGRIVTRDYFVAESENHLHYWIYRERVGSRDEREPRWFLHGLFG